MNNIKDWTRVALYGTYDGFSQSTFGDDNIHLILDNGDRVEVPNHFVKNASDFVEKNKIKLKDIIARMEGLSEHTRSEWLNDILYKFGNDYGTLKYKDGYEQGKFEASMIPYEEPQKVVVPHFVADWISYVKGWNKSLHYALSKASDEVLSWFCEDKLNRQEIFARAWLDGYEVEKEKRYTVKMRATKQPLFYNNMYEKIFFSLGELATRFTRKELEQAGFREVFNSPLFEVEEVEE